MENRSELIARVGMFFYLLAAGLMLLFIGSDLGDDPQFDLFFLSLGAGLFGFILRKKGPKPQSSDRFKSMRQLREKSKQRNEAKQKK
ncbi:MAG: hypothetical protein JXB85_06565 [Anaerolineales bacterium]|nr:hypothetical protein [Anaerolineales bacterium]